MKVLFDTSVLVAAIVDSHPAHKLALPWLQKVQKGTLQGVVAAHSVAELYAILTRLPVRPRISPQLAQQSIKRHVRTFFTVVSLSGLPANPFLSVQSVPAIAQRPNPLTAYPFRLLSYLG